MDKSVGANKRRQDKRHKKPHPEKVSASSGKVTQKRSETEPAPLIVYDDKYSKRVLEPNWNTNRNISPLNSDSDDEQLNAADLGKLLSAPLSAGGHFFLSTEKHWEAEAEEQSITSGKTGQYGQYFQIDTKQLNTSIRSIPLFERNEYPKELFSKREIDCMKLSANRFAEKITERNIPAKMSDNPSPPVKCLIGADALPARTASPSPEPTPAPPVPCLIGPMALPPELRNNPNITGSIASRAPAPPVPCLIGPMALPPPSTAPAAPVAVVTTSNSTDDVVPIGNIEEEPSASTSSGKEENPGSSAVPRNSNQVKDSKEDIQQWLDDILEM